MYEHDEEKNPKTARLIIKQWLCTKVRLNAPILAKQSSINRFNKFMLVTFHISPWESRRRSGNRLSNCDRQSVLSNQSVEFDHSDPSLSRQPKDDFQKSIATFREM